MADGDPKVARYVSPGTGPESGQQSHAYRETARTDATTADPVLVPEVVGLDGDRLAKEVTAAAVKVATEAIRTAVEGTLSVSGPLTDIQLRAAAVAITAASLPLPSGAATSAKQDAAQARLNLLATETTLGTIRDRTPDPAFRRALKAEPESGEEFRRDETATDDYHGLATDGTATSAASWSVCRFYKDASGLITRIRYRTGVAWDSRTAGWT